MPEEQQPLPQQPKSTRSYEEWREALIQLAKKRLGAHEVTVKDEKAKPFYEQGFMPAVAFKSLFNK